MKLIEIKQLKDNNFLKKIINELKVNGLDKIYVKRTKSIDYLDIIVSVLNFLEENKNLFKKLSNKNYENLILIIFVEILEEIDIETNEEQLEKIITLLKSSLLVQRASSAVIEYFKVLCKKICFCNFKNSIETSERSENNETKVSKEIQSLNKKIMKNSNYNKKTSKNVKKSLNKNSIEIIDSQIEVEENFEKVEDTEYLEQLELQNMIEPKYMYNVPNVQNLPKVPGLPELPKIVENSIRDSSDSSSSPSHNPPSPNVPKPSPSIDE